MMMIMMMMMMKGKGKDGGKVHGGMTQPIASTH